MDKLQVSIVIFIKNITNKSLELWVQKRIDNGPLQGKLEFPGGKLEEGESPRQAAIREVLEEVEVDISASPLIFYRYFETHYKNPVLLHVYVSNFTNIEAEKGQWKSIDYVQKSEYLRDTIPEINHEIIDELVGYFSNQTADGNVERINKLWELSQH